MVPGVWGRLSSAQIAELESSGRVHSPNPSSYSLPSAFSDRLKPFVVPGVTGPVAPAVAAGEVAATASPIPPGAAMEMQEISPAQVRKVVLLLLVLLVLLLFPLVLLLCLLLFLFLLLLLLYLSFRFYCYFCCCTCHLPLLHLLLTATDTATAVVLLLLLLL